MPKPDPKVLLRHAGNYLKAHPEEIARALRGALGLRVGVPIDALRYLARELGGGRRAPKDVVIEAAPPGLRLALTVDAMGTPLRASFAVYAEELDVRADAIQVGLRIADLKIDVLGDQSSPIAGLLGSGAIDLSKPGNLVSFLPRRPAALIDAKDDKFTLDLLKIPALGRNRTVARALRICAPVLGVRALKTKDDHLDVHLKAIPSGIAAAIAAARSGV
ncbi:hypothetical protein SOCEGT47_027320 [Sorangium cellulosum]|jgi:hypothetical protein|uniref:Uncharacterized protein n=1 Tax=Sorangium cellulosum TaxID=56 RepID=A0A4P2PZQ8_SORCE|nr:hypothetical protein [Sorangium cellulosum]AUX22231.1 hypothetical protein SOCEGT47_027320 [Sorangium cellulosum]